MTSTVSPAAVVVSEAVLYFKNNKSSLLLICFHLLFPLNLLVMTMTGN